MDVGSPCRPAPTSADAAAQHKPEEPRPFVQPSADAPTPPRQHLGHGAWPHHTRPRPCWKLSVFFVLAALSVVVLSALSLAFQPPPSPATQDEHGDGGHPQPPDNSHHDGGEPHGSVHHHNEDMPSVPRLRDAAQYVLNPNWDPNAAPAAREYHWAIVDGRLNPDGIYRPMILINNQYPGPLVECNEGDTIVIHVDNQAVNATSIHFHGLFQNGTNAMDGAVGITQCPIAPNSTFTYTFQVRGQSGTYWYHAHHSAQASDGLLGPVVVHSKDERILQKLEYATDRVVMVQDHYHNLTSEMLMDYLKPGMENNEPVPDNALINGRGVRDCKDFPGWECDAANVSTPIFDLVAGQRHRLRIINVGAFAEFQIQFDEHPLYVTEVDGTDVHPEPIHRLNILPAQRYSVILETNVTAADSFWMRARMVAHCFTTKNPRLQAEARAIVRYVSPAATAPAPHAPDKEPASHEWPGAIEVICRDLDTSALRPVVPMAPPPADDFVFLQASFMIGAWRLSRGFFNDSTWHPNLTRPSLHRFLDAGPEAASSVSSPLGFNNVTFAREAELVLQTRGIRTVDVSINNFDDGAHPFHLHGHKFFVLAQGRSGYPPATAADLSAYLGEHGPAANPLRRDTVTVEGYAWAVIRVVLDNPGFWALHCHNLWHAESGMLMQMLVRSDVVGGWDVDPKHRAMCELPGVGTGMRPDDGLWFGHFGR